MEHFYDLTLAQIYPVIKVVILILIGGALLLLTSKALRKHFSKRFSAQLGLIVSKTVLYTGMSILLISVLRELGFKLTTLLGAAGIVGIAVGFASQTSVSNIISGLFLITDKAFEINDVISVGHTTGVVLSIDLLSVKLRTFDNRFVRIPNETLIKSELTNMTRFPIRRVDIPVGVAYKENIGKVRDILLEIAKQEPLCLNEPEPMVVMTGFGSYSVDLLLLVWAVKTDWLKVKNTITETIKKRFDEEGVEIPFPHLSVYTGLATKPFPIDTVSGKKN
ncbi:MAG: mechanosensitive ion channel family protein [Calditrichaeota bacterium]|nr:MAG: mechanosensitive ion channel family protein [Calditrichota bacterium]